MVHPRPQPKSHQRSMNNVAWGVPNSSAFVVKGGRLQWSCGKNSNTSSQGFGNNSLMWTLGSCCATDASGKLVWFRQPSLSCRPQLHERSGSNASPTLVRKTNITAKSSKKTKGGGRRRHKTKPRQGGRASCDNGIQAAPSHVGHLQVNILRMFQRYLMSLLLNELE